MTIQLLRIEVVPWILDNRSIEARIQVFTEKGQYGSAAILPDEHFESVFDQIFECAKKSILREIKNHKEPHHE